MIYQCILRALLPASLLAAAFGTAAAQPDLEAKTTVLSAPVKLVGEVSVKDLPKRPAIARPARHPVEMPKHRLPDGSLTSAPRKSILEKLPSLSPVPNVNVLPATSPLGFVAIHSSDNAPLTAGEVEPPDQGLAVNNNIAAEINNDALRFFNATTGAALPYDGSAAPIDIYSFFVANPANLVSDPQAFFDTTTGRWFFTVLESDQFATEQLDVAVSQTSDPLGSYYIYHVRAASSDLFGCGFGFGLDCLPDYPKAGYDANGLYISVDLFEVFFGNFVAAATYALPKSKLEAGTGFTYVRVTYPNDFVVQPSVPAPGEPYVTAANGTEYLLEARNIQDSSNKIRVWAISNTNNIVKKPSSLRAKYVDVLAEPYGPTVAATEPSTVVPNGYCAAQGVTSAPQLDGGYQSFQATIQKASGKLYGSLPFGATDSNGLNRDVVAWFVIAPSVNNLTGVPVASIPYQGYVIPPNGYSLLNPAFGINKSGTGFLGFSITSPQLNLPGNFPSTAFIPVTATGVTASTVTVSGQGITPDDGFSGCDPTQPTFPVGRWGDYGAATVDAATGYFYTANENISGQRGTYTNWGTYITQLH